MTDLFAAFYRADVRWISTAPTEGTPFHKAALERLLASPSYRRLHPDISGNLDDAAAVLTPSPAPSSQPSTLISSICCRPKPSLANANEN